MTYRDVVREDCYDEVIFNESPIVAIARMTNVIDSIASVVKEAGAKPCFATIVPASISSWNNTRLAQHKTSHLLHHRHYPHMQANMIKTILAVNQHITSVNISNNMSTPFLADTIIKFNNPKPPRIIYSRLEDDGVHPTVELKASWADIISETIRRNRTKSPSMCICRSITLSDSEDELQGEMGDSCKHMFK